ncbi:Eco57I restriction-modification methylase domain-containing protein [Clostridium perfringens]|uniref:Eco57I restriction-modification methylase domain-containing protein n=1 Tax=Clostridium perfringens TaxID=1502 RepID=UPI0024BBF57D|nr:Eco57I restriction-modification methylase domain-containing protein [Clostridium perfringens]
MLEINYIKNIFRKMGFSLKNGEKNTWYKSFSNHNNYEISVLLNETNYKNSSINYGGSIEVVRSTTSNLSDDENLVVLECVNRLLEKGYKPSNIVLEKDFKVGHKPGYLDIYIKDDNGKCYMMVECKTYGKEYSKELNKLRKNGGQLLSYFSKDKNAKVILLYSSTIQGDTIKYKNDIIITDTIQEAKNDEELFEQWDKSTKINGVFEDWVEIYNVQYRNITKGQLIPLDEETGHGLYNEFEEVLRRNVISDKTNAFNKIFNLFICKIYDEDTITNPLDEVKFQIKENDKPKDVIKRLEELYEGGLKDFLEIEIEDKYYSPIHEFAFSDIYNNDSFKKNYKVLEEVIKLLQNYELKYTSKQQFLGDFFERLLFTGIKQQSGQYFTPTPVARFICKSIPIKNIIDKKINNVKEKAFLPYIIDYASGSGHFIIEMMDEIQGHLDNMDENEIKSSNTVRKNFRKQRYDFDWAEEYVYGIEKDYRLAKTTKVSGFLNGDGEATIINGDGLGNFKREKSYRGILKSNKDDKDNPVFDILVANPPYSVDGFKNTLENGELSFDLYKYLTDNSKEIECLFVERAKQLLKEGGYLGIILPNTILKNKSKQSKIYGATRDILINNFNIKGIIELGNKTFMETTTTTVVILAQRRNDNELRDIIDITRKFIISKSDCTCNGIENAFSHYCEYTYNMNLNDFIKLFDCNLINEIEDTDIYLQYKKLFKPIEDEILNNIQKKNNTLIRKKSSNENKLKKLEERILSFTEKLDKLDKTKDKEKIEKIENKLSEFKSIESELLNDEIISILEREIEQLKESISIKFLDFISNKELKKMVYFFLVYKQEIVLVNSPEDSNKQKAFLGYEFINARGKEDFKIHKEDGKIINSLYDEEDLYNKDRINSYILKVFEGEKIENVSENLEDVLIIKELHKMMNFQNIDFDNVISTSFLTKEDYTFNTKFKNSRLRDIKQLDYISGVTYEKDDESIMKTDKRILTASNISNYYNEVILDEEKYLNENVNISDEKKLIKNDIFLCTSSGSLEHLGKSAFINNDLGYYFGGFCAVLRTDDYYLSKYIYYMLNTREYRNYILTKKGQNINNLNQDLLEFEIPLPNKKYIKEIVDERDSFERTEIEKRILINNYMNEIQEITKEILQKNTVNTTIGDKFIINPSKQELESFDDNMKVSFIDMSSISTEGTINKRVIKKLGDVKKDYTYFADNDVIFAKITPCMENGKGAYAHMLENGIGFGSTEFFIFRSKGEYSSKLLYYYLQSNKLRMEAKNVMTGKAGHKRVPKEFLEKYNIPDIDLNIQNQLVEKLDELNIKIENLKNEISLIKSEKIKQFMDRLQ